MPKDKTIPPKFDGTNIPDDFYFPPCGIEDMDKALELTKSLLERDDVPEGEKTRLKNNLPWFD